MGYIVVYQNTHIYICMYADMGQHVVHRVTVNIGWFANTDALDVYGVECWTW